MAQTARSVIDTILGEAGGKTVADRYRDMLGIASVMANRAAATGQPLQSIVSAPNQFSAYGKSLPKGVEKFEALARMAVEQVTNWGPVHNATYYATPAATKNLPKGLNPVTETTAHQYFTDPQNRAIGTAQGYVTPSREALEAYAPASQKSAGLAALAPNGLIGQAQSATGPKDKLGRQPIGQVDFDRIGLDPNFAARMKDYAAAAQSLGLDLSVDVTNARRTPEQQAAIQAAGYSKTKNSYHIPGFALDVSAANLNALDQPDPATQAAARQLAASMGLGLLNPAFDPAHIQVNVPGLSAAKLMSMPVDAFGNVQLSPEQALAVRADSVPTPTARPNPETAIASGVPAQSVKTSSFSPPAGTVNDMPDTAGIGFFGGQAGSFAGVPAKSVKTTSYTPDTAVASVDTSKSAYAPEESPASKALADLASRTKDDAITEIAGAPVGQSAVAPSSAYATTNLPGYDYTPPSVTAMAPEPVAPAPIEVAPPAAITPPSPVFTPQTVAPAPVAAPAPAAAAPSIPSGTKAALDFHAGLNNAAVASNGNTLTRDAMGYSYNYSPEFDVTTISNPAGDTVGVKQGKVTADSAASATNASKGIFGLDQDTVSNSVVGGLGGLGGAAVGGLFGPVGSLIGSAIGRQLAVQNNPFATPGAQPSAGLFGLGGLGGLFGGIFGGRNSYPSAPNAPSALGGRQSNRSVGEMRGISPRAAGDIEAGRQGLF
ncbi:MAG: hypothetical protein WA975_03455 [Mesorhizobium sp.]